MACDRTEEDVLSYVYGELTEDEAREFAEHLTSCERCAETERRYRAVMAELDVVADAEPPPELARKIAALVPAASTTRHWRPDLITRRLKWLAAAAALVVVVALYFIPWGGVLRPAYAEEIRVEKLPGGYEITVFSSKDGAPPPPRPLMERQAAQRRSHTGNRPFQVMGVEQFRASAQTDEYRFLDYLSGDTWPRDTGLALVRDRREIWNLKRGDNIVRFTDVAARIDPTSVSWTSDTDPVGTRVVEQNYEFDLASADAILERYIDKKITCRVATDKGMETVEGHLASYDPRELVLAEEAGSGKVETLARENVREVMFGELPEGLLTKPTLVWKLRTKTPGEHKSTLMYLTAGMSWFAKYVVVVGPDDVLDLDGWVSLTNRSGSTYENARLKLIAGDVHRVEPEPQPRRAARRWLEADAARTGEATGFVEKAFFEYHLYTLGRRTTIRDRQTKQIELLSRSGAKSTRRYVYSGGRDVNVVLEVWNKEDNHLGMPLPKGEVSLMARDGSGELELIGKCTIDHTPKDEKIKLTIGRAFDIAAERTQTAQRRTGPRSDVVSIRVNIRNHKGADVTVDVVERIGRADWSMRTASHEYDKKDFQTLEFHVPVKANSESALTYTVDRRW
jgi:hypothetical protein